MDTQTGKLTVFFEEPFWVGVFERISEGRLSVCKVTFGGEPKDCEIWEFILKRYGHLAFSPAVKTEVKRTPDNHKRRQRDAKKQLHPSGVGTKSQQARQTQREELKAHRNQLRKERKDAERQRQFELKQQKRKAKHRGH